MAISDINTTDGTVGYTDCVANNIPSRAFRYTVENKNLLAQKGAMYVGTGETKVMRDSTSSYESAKTGVIPPPSNNGTYVLKCTVEGGVVTSIGWELVTNS